MSKPFDEFYVRLAGERSVVAWLEEKGFTVVKWDAESPGSKSIEAKSGSARVHLLVQVRVSVQPEDPPSLTSGEERDIMSRAAKIGAEAWEARVQLDPNLRLLGKIRWRKLFPLEASKGQMG